MIFTKIKKAKFNYLMLVVLFLNCTKSETVWPNNDAVKNFMIAVIEEFRAGLDLIRFELPHVVDINDYVAIIHGELNEIFARGINNFRSRGVWFDLSLRTMTYIIQADMFYISGGYNLTALISSTYPISGNGQWQMEIFDQYIDSRASFNVVDGYVVFDSTPRKYTNSRLIYTSFPGFISEEDYDGLGKDVILALQNNIQNNILTNTTDLIFEGLSNLFQSRFSEMTLVDIIGNYTNPPTTTTTTPRTTTTDPCGRSPLFTYPQESNMQILSQDIEENEDEIIVTRIYKEISKIAKK